MLRMIQEKRTTWTKTKEKSWRSLTHVSEEELETTEGEGVNILAELLELVGWPQG